MKKSSLTAPRDYLAFLVRRKWWIIVPFLALSMGVVVFVFMLPGMYVSETLIVIQPRDVPQDFVKDLISGTAEQRLTAIEQTVLSRTNLIQILRQFEGNLLEFRNLNSDEKVLKLKNQIEVVFDPARRRSNVPLTYFKIAYRNQNPELAQKLASRLAALFIEQDNRTREIQVFGTTEFLNTEVQKLADELKLSEEQLKTLKERYRYQLPEQLDTNLRTLDRLETQQKANIEALDRFITMKMNLERDLSETPPYILRPVQENRTGNPLPDQLKVQEFRKKERAYNDLVARYTPIHPDVRRAKAELERIKKEIPPQDLAWGPPSESKESLTVSVPNPVYQSLTAQLRQVKTEMEIREREKKWTEVERDRYYERIQNAPRVEQQVQAYLRNHADLNKHYEEMKGKLSQARLAESLESRQKGAQFVIVDPANYPLLPSKPNRKFLITAGVLLCLAVSALIALSVDFADQKIWSHYELERLFGIPVVAEIPEIVTEADLRRARLKRIACTVAGLIAATTYAGGLYLVHLKQAAVLRGLDTLIERLMF